MTPDTSAAEAYLNRRLHDAPREHNYRYTNEARLSLLNDLFLSLACNQREYLRLFFPRGAPYASDDNAWNLSAAQGAVEGAEYSTAARGKPCGHIFKNGEATYRCKTCSFDDTCVLCGKCFESSDHSGHHVYVNISPGNSGCCDCGDPEAWRTPVKCAIHTKNVGESSEMDAENSYPDLPDDLVAGIRMTIGRAIDYLCDVISCSPEQLRLVKSEEAIRKDEMSSRLISSYYEAETDSDNVEYALVLWNDEKHTINEVEQQVARACKKPMKFGKERAQETDFMGRSIVIYSFDIAELMKKSRIIEQIKVTVTIRSARDTFREQMCGTIIEWLGDIAGCSVGGNNDILRTTICEELLGVWRTGSKASNTKVGRRGLDDHSYEDETEELGRSGFVVPLETATGLFAREINVGNTTEGGEGAAGEGDVDHDEDVDMIGRAREDVTRHVLISLGQLPAPMAQPDMSDEPVDDDDEDSPNGPPKIPHTPGIHHVRRPGPPAPAHWLEKPAGFITRRPLPLPPHEDLQQRVRLDWLILFDLRLWKKARVDLRDLYISTVVAIPEFKRILGLRFAGLYTTLSQLYLIADREPDHSIINLSLQMLTTPSITAEVVRRGNFLTNLMAILYTFLTTRQVGHPHEINKEAILAFDAGSLTNRRMFHFFQDMRYLFGSDFVKERLRNEERYMLQFLDLTRLHQGICPNQRAVGEHVEYEAEAWISASLITREINKLSRQFSEAFRWSDDPYDYSLQRAIATVARYAIVNSMGWERHRFHQAELKSEVEFRQLGGFEFDTDRCGSQCYYNVIKFAVDKQHISFHHALHFTLSWLIEAGKNMSVEDLRKFLMLDWEHVRNYAGSGATQCEPEDLAIVMFDYPLRVCVWLAQMKAGMWIRNGFSLKHQMQAYKGVSQRDLTHNRDLFLLQTALVTINPSRMLVSMIDRFNLDHWMQGNYDIQDGYEESQVLELVEDFLHLLIVLLSDRLPLTPVQEEPDLSILKLKREIIHILCFKPIQFSELCARLPERLQDHEMFQEILSELTNFRPPDGLSDSGTFELKEKYLDEVDPYIMQFSKNQREEMENSYRTRVAKKTGQPENEVVFEPSLRPIKTGVFKEIAAFTKTPIFAQVIYYSLAYTLRFRIYTPNIPDSRMEIFLQLCLHLCQLAVTEDKSMEGEEGDSSFVLHALEKEAHGRSGNAPPVGAGDNGHKTIASVLYRLAGMDEFKACWPKVNNILRRMRQKKPTAFGAVTLWAHEMGEKMETENEQNVQAVETERKKQLAKDRQAKIMEQMKQQQQSFMNSAGFDFGSEDYSDSETEATMEDQEGEKKLWKYPAGTCILCQEEMDDSHLYGALALVTDSKILRQTTLHDPEYVYEVATTPESLDRPADDIRPFGVASMNRDTVKKLGADGSELVAERQGLGRGFPPQFIKRGPVAVSCSHTMHFSCFEHYCDSIRRRYTHQIARNHPERLEKKEFVCPLCKALGNTFFPIIWRSKEETPTGVLQPVTGFEAWLSEQIGPAISRQEKAVEGGNDKNTVTKLQKLFLGYGSSNMITTIASKLRDLSTVQIDTRSSEPPGPGGGTDVRGSVAGRIPVPQTGTDELHKIYRRLRDTLRVNHVRTTFKQDKAWSQLDTDLTHCDSLAKLLGWSIAAVEISLRGIGSEPGSTLLDRISQQNLMHLRILSETVTSYICIGGLQSKEDNHTICQFKEMQMMQTQQLFIGHPHISFFDNGGRFELDPLLHADLFIFFAECSVCLVPALGLDVLHVLRLCYIAEIVKTVIAIGRDCHLDVFPDVWDQAGRKDNVEGHASFTHPQLSKFRNFIKFIGQACEGKFDFNSLPLFPLAVFHNLIKKYILPFLRKSIILLHTRYGVLFPPTGYGEIDDPELMRLSKALRLPDIDQIYEDCLADNGDGNFIRAMVSGWCMHWRAFELKSKDDQRNYLTLSHPSIFELVGLPLHYDTLVEEAMKRRCPNTGKDLTDPSVCLFCGAIFCSQAFCCIEDGLGGCNVHMKKCAKDVGLFINIRKCCVLYLHNGNGTFATAPYLDKHGETDQGLKRNRQLFLNQRRYDALLRTVWLQHGIPSVISRKMEADVNNGGWETI